MAIKILFSVSLSLVLAYICLSSVSNAAPSSVSFADDSGAYAGAGDTYAMASPSGAKSGAGPIGTSSGSSGGGSSLLLGRSGGSSSPSQSRMQGVVIGSNGDTTVLQQNGDQPAKVYKISGTSG